MYKIYIDNQTNSTFIIIKGYLSENLIKDLNNLSIFLTYPKINLICNLKKTSKYVQTNIYCHS